ncbi:Gfo/Idh/MocA family protein [Rhizobium mongolense]|uniref:Dehydrogenase n=2 Tax=Rhizobium mongolense TaxID=57676 RepID=A0ABR6IHU3_9HYPH|nr:Gfo/Idh/MocA family oxidoreductase [Rhizobium mongolense]MBB4227208.1 putative dehydrogenase [Rhizobium mongolense]TVZ74373.1 putative dehydrogenase [Rhizobium mongolense USDA 1844]
MIRKEDRRLRVGVLGCGPIAQFAHLESCAKARNADLYAICEAAPDLLARMGATYEPQKMYADYDAMLADAELEAVIIATSDAYHVPMSIKALDAGKHVLCEKPTGVTIEEGQALADAVKRSGKVLQVGHMKRFDPALEAARDFVRDDIGAIFALKAWYCDSTHRYTNTDAVQPLPITSKFARKPAGNPKADLRQYFMLAHGSHLVDTARFLCGGIVAVRARLLERANAYCWFVETEFANGALGHLDLTVAVRMDWHEGFHLYGENGSVIAKTFNPWYLRASEVEIFHEKDATTRKPLGADGHFFRRQLEGLADTVLNGARMRGADIEDGIASIRAMVAIARSVETGERVELATVTGSV